MDITTFYPIMILFFMLVLGGAALQDVMAFKISNLWILALLVTYPIYVYVAPAPIDWIWSLGLFVGFFLLGTVLFSLGVMGGGDVKLIAVAALWVGMDAIVPFILYMGLAGGVLAILMLSPLRGMAAYYCGQMGWIHLQGKLIAAQLPYGVAIATGGVIAASQLM